MMAHVEMVLSGTPGVTPHTLFEPAPKNDVEDRKKAVLGAIGEA
jgi:hypothetical protein